MSIAWPSSPFNPPVLGANPAGLVVAFGVGDSSAYWLNVHTWAPVTGGTIYQVKRVQWFAAANQFFVIGSNSGLTGPALFRGSGTATWTNDSAAIPSTFSAVTAYWEVAASPTRLVAIPRIAGSAFYMTSDNGTTWTSRSTFSALAGETCVALEYGAAEGIFMAVVQHTSGQIRHVKSTDGITWTAAGTNIATAGWAISGLTVAGTLWAMCGMKDDGGGLSHFGVWTSVDAGANWRPSDAYLVNDGSAPDKNGITTDGYRFIASNTQKLLVGRYSAGLRPRIT